MQEPSQWQQFLPPDRRPQYPQGQGPGSGARAGYQGGNRKREPSALDVYFSFYGKAVKQNMARLFSFDYGSRKAYQRVWTNPYHKRKIILVIAVVSLFLIYTLLTSMVYPERNTQLSAYSSSWNDVSEFRQDLSQEGYDVKSIQSSPTVLKDYFAENGEELPLGEEPRDNDDEPEDGEDVPDGYQKFVDLFTTWGFGKDLTGTAVVILGVERRYSDEEISTLANYVEEGGNLLLADDFGYGNIFKGVFDMGFSKYQLYDRNYDKNTAFVEAQAHLPTGLFSVLLNKPSTVANSAGATVYMSSNSNSFIDKNGDRKADNDELGNNFPLCVSAAHGDGRLILISDPGIFINDMLDRADNRAFALALVDELLPAGGTVIFDESVHIAPGYFSNGVHTVLTSLYILKANVYYSIILMIIVIIVVEVSVFLVRDPIKLFKPRPMRNQASNVRYLKKSLARREEMRNIFLERLRVELGMSKAGFSKLPKQEIAQLIDNDELARFLFDANFQVAPSYYSNYMEMMEDWYLGA